MTNNFCQFYICIDKLITTFILTKIYKNLIPLVKNLNDILKDDSGKFSDRNKAEADDLTDFLLDKNAGMLI